MKALYACQFEAGKELTMNCPSSTNAFLACDYFNQPLYRAAYRKQYTT